MNKYISKAATLSLLSTHHTYKIGCVIVKHNKVLGMGYNKLKTHPMAPHEYKYTHAEFMAAYKANNDIKGATVYVFRQQKSGQMACAKPCKSCWNYLLALGVKEVVYSDYNEIKQELVA